MRRRISPVMRSPLASVTTSVRPCALAHARDASTEQSPRGQGPRANVAGVPRASQQRNDHGAPQREQHVPDRVGDAVAERRHRALGRSPGWRRAPASRCRPPRTRRAARRAACGRPSGRPPRRPRAGTSTVRRPATTSVTPAVRRPVTKSGPALRPDDGDEAGEAERLEHPQRRRRESRPKNRGHTDRSQPQVRPPTSTPTLRLRPISTPPSNKRGQADERAGDDAEGDEHHVAGVGRAVGDADPRRGLGDAIATARPASRRRRGGATVSGNTGIWRAGAGDPAKEDAAREVLAGEVGERPAVDVRGGHDDVERIGGDVRAAPHRPPRGCPSGCSSILRNEELAPSDDGDAVAGLQDAWCPSVRRSCRHAGGARRTAERRAPVFEITDALSGQREPWQDVVGTPVDLAAPSRRHRTAPPASRARSGGIPPRGRCPSAAGPVCARNQAAPTTPIR